MDMTPHKGAAAPSAGRAVGDRRLDGGDEVPVRRFVTIRGDIVDLAAESRPAHIQFRRFAGCPVCNVHLQGFVHRWSEVGPAVREIVLFHAEPEELQKHAGDLPFAVVADPRKAIYRAFGVEAGYRALGDPRAWPTILGSIAIAVPAVLAGRHHLPSRKPSGGRLGLPADFLVASDGNIVARHYGAHAGDHWSVDDVLALARRTG